MRNLPSKQKELIEKAKCILIKEKRLRIQEPCNCGSHIRHNNGGNYHDIISLAIDSGKYYRKYSDTCELTPNGEWGEITEEKAMETIEEHADWL